MIMSKGDEVKSDEWISRQDFVDYCARFEHQIKMQEQKITELKKKLDESKKHLKLALSFAPKGDVPKGLSPMSYHTLNYEEDVKLQERIDKAREFLKGLE